MARLFPTIVTHISLLCIFFILLAPKASAPSLPDISSNGYYLDDLEESDDGDDDVYCLKFVKVGDFTQIPYCDDYCKNTFTVTAEYGEWHTLKELVSTIGGVNVFDLVSGTDYSDSQNDDLVQNGDESFCFCCTEKMIN